MTRRPKPRERRADIDPEPIDSALQRFTSTVGWHEQLALAKIREGWIEVVGPMLAPRSRPDSLHHGVLSIDCDHGVTANELAMLVGPIRDSASKIASVQVKEIRTRVRRARG